MRTGQVAAENRRDDRDRLGALAAQACSRLAAVQQPLTLTLEVDRSAASLRGSVIDDAGARYDFAGLVDLVQVLRELGLPLGGQSPAGDSPDASRAPRS